MTYLLDTEWILGWTQISRWNSHQRMIKLSTNPPERRLNCWARPYAQMWDHNLQNNFWEQIRTHASIRESKIIRLCAPVTLHHQPRAQTYPHLHHLRQTLAQCQKGLSSHNCCRAFRTHPTPSLSAASKLRTNGRSRDTILSTTTSSISNVPSSTTSPANGDIFLTSLSSLVELIIQTMNDVANEVLHGGFIYSLKNS